MNLLLHFWLATGLISLAALALQWRVRRRAPLTLSAGAAILAAGAIAIGSPAFAFEEAGKGPSFKIVAFNLWQGSRSPRAAAEWILDERPDIVVLVEAKERAAAVPALLSIAYPYRLSCHRNASCSTLILSRRPPDRAVPLARGDAENRRALSATRMDFGDATIVGIHLSRPWPLGTQRRELAELDAALAVVPQRGLIVAGDFNASMSTFAMRRLASAHELRPAGSWAPTWPAPGFRSGVPAFIAIDHILVGSGWSVEEIRRGPALGSDHYPLVATLRRRTAEFVTKPANHPLVDGRAPVGMPRHGQNDERNLSSAVNIGRRLYRGYSRFAPVDVCDTEFQDGR